MYSTGTPTAQVFAAQSAIIDASLGLTFLDLAETANNANTRSRLISEAHNAYKAIVRVRPRTVLTDGEKLSLDEKMSLLRARLTAVGIVFQEPDSREVSTLPGN